MTAIPFENVLIPHDHDSWQIQLNSEHQTQATKFLEQGKILFFPQLQFTLSDQEKIVFQPDYVKNGSKNISFNRKSGEIGGIKAQGQDIVILKNMLHRYAESAAQLIDSILPKYRENLAQARTSFRPVQISNRKTSYRKDDKRLHVDAFPATPNRGLRILRVFTNINPNGENRVWRVGEDFETVATKFIPGIKKPFPGSSYVLRALQLTKSLRSEYDHIMLQLHDRMKADLSYQQSAPQTEIQFPPGSTWVVQTDQVSHAAMAGQHLLEQTFYLPVHAMLNPETSPLKVLEKMIGRELA